MEDEGPSPEDLDRFDGDTAYCPDCGEEIWDQVELCPECGAHLPDGPQREQPDKSAPFKNKVIGIIVALTALGLVGWYFL